MTQINVEEISKVDMDILGRSLIKAAKAYFEIPENQKKYEEWLAQRKQNES